MVVCPPKLEERMRPRSWCQAPGSRRLGRFQLQPVRLDLGTDLGQKIIANPALHQRIAEPAVGVAAPGIRELYG